MIDTLFYFVDTELEYRRLMQGEDGTPGISPTTIVFVGDSREIYVNGKGYGKTSTNGLLASSEFDQWKGHLNDRIDNAINDASSANAIARQKAEEDLAAAMETIQGIIDDTSDEMSSDILAVQQQLQEAKEQLQANIDSANLNADEILSDLTTFQGTIRNELETSIRDAITNADGRTIWSELNTTNEGITAMTNRINKSLDANGDLKNTEVLQSIIDSGVKDNKAVTDILSKWAVLDENQNLLEWVASGFRSEANKEGGLAAMFATAQDDTQNAIANVKTEIEQDVAGNYVASVDLASNVVGIVEDELNVESLSAIAMKNDVNQATTTITNRLNTADQDRQNIHTSLSQISSVAEEGKARASLLTSVDENGTYFINESSLDGAVNSMLAKSGSESAALIHLMAQADIAEADISAQIEDATSVLATKVSVEQVVNNLTGEIENRKTAVAGLQAQISGEDGLTNAIAGVRAKANANEASITSLAEWKEGDLKTWQAGVVQTANLDGAVAGLIAEGTKESAKKVKAAVVATVNDDTSAIAINADHIFVDAGKTTTIGSSYDSKYNPDKNGVNTSIATLKTNTDDDRANLTAISTWKDNKGYVADAGLVTDASLDGAMVSLFAKDTSGAKAAVVGMVNDGLSTLTLTADKVFIDGELNVTIQSHYDGELEDIGRDIDALEGTVSGHTTSIAAVDTKAEKNKSDISAITTWKNNTESWKSGVLTTAGLGGAVANLFAENANTDAKANVTAMVNDKLSTLTLSADKVYINGQQGVNIKSYFDSELDDAIDGVEGDITSLGNTVAGHTTSISEINTKANNTASSLEALSTWKDGFVNTYKAGLVTETGLAGAMAQLIAENGDVKASITNRVKDDASEIELNADQIKLSGSTLADRIEATEGTIGGIAIANNNIHSGNNKFSVTNEGKLTATDAEITGKITATQLILGSNKISTSDIDGLSAVATSGNYSSLNGTPTIPSKVSLLTNDSGFINSSALNGYALAQDVPKDITDLTGTADILYKSNITTTETTGANGIKTKTITVGNKSYTTISDNNGFIYTNIGVGTQSNDHTSSYFKLSTDGLLEANNALIYGTIYATDGEFTGTINATALNLVGNTKINASKVDGLSAIATSGSYNSLSDKPTIPSKVSQLTNDSGFINSSALNGYALSSSIPKAVSDLTGSADIVHTANITTEEKTVNGVKVKTISLGGGKSYTTISDNNGFIYTNVGYGTLDTTNHSTSYFQVSTDGLLEANNAVIYGTIYATNGSFSGEVNASSGNIGGIQINNNGIASSNGNFSLTNAGALTATGASIGGTINATGGKIGALSINSNGMSAENIDPTFGYVTDSYFEGDGLKTTFALLTKRSTFDYGVFGLKQKRWDVRDANSQVVVNELRYDGSGHLGCGGIQWDSDGRFTVRQIDSLNATYDNSYGGVSNTHITGDEITMENFDSNYNSIGGSAIRPGEILVGNESGSTTIDPAYISLVDEDADLLIYPGKIVMSSDTKMLVKDGNTTYTGLTQNVTINSVSGSYLGSNYTNLQVTLQFRNGILVGIDKHGFPGSLT